jgi:alpha-tubulin suppressor-like RCC1 family protein
MSFPSIRREFVHPCVSVFAVAIVGHAYAAGGPVIAWGSNESGQCNVPASLGNARQVACGGWHSLAISMDGSVRAWGASGAGQAPAPAGLGACTAVAGGLGHSIGIADVYWQGVAAWGSNDWGQCVGDAIDSVVALAAGRYHSVYVRADGTVIARGSSQYGQVAVPPQLNDAIAVAAGEGHSIALRRGGQVIAWGWNYYGQCDVPSGTRRCVAIASGDNHGIALLSDGTVSCWGSNGSGQCDTPAGLGNVRQVAGGWYFSLALLADGSLAGWGSVPQQPSALPPLVGIAGGAGHALGIACNATAMHADSGELAPFSVSTPRNWTALVGQVDAARGATLTVQAIGDLGTATKFIVVRVDGQLVGTAFGQSSGAGACTANASTVTFTLSPTMLADVASDGEIAVSLVPSVSATSTGCASATLRASLSWYRPMVDCNSNGNDDACEIEAGPAALVDCNGNGIIDSCDIAGGTSADADGDAQPDECQADCDGNHLPDEWEIATGRASDCNSNGRPDRCDVAPGGGSADVDSNGIPDECEADCNGNRVPDPYEISLSPEIDCDRNGLIDACEVLRDRQVTVWGPGATSAGLMPPSSIVAPLAVYPGNGSVIVREYADRLVAWGNPSNPATQVPSTVGSVVAVSTALGSGSCPERRLALRSDGTMIGWGGSCNADPDPMPTGVLGVAKGVNGSFHALIVDGGKVRVCGNSLLTYPSGMTSGIVSVAKGGGIGAYEIILALKADGSLRVENRSGYGPANPPISAQPASAVAAGLQHCLALRTDGHVVGWGRNDDSQCNSPSGVFTAIDAVDHTSLGLRPDGSVEVWGRDAAQLAAPQGARFAGASFGKSSSGIFVVGLAVSGSIDCNIDGVLDACQVGAFGPDCDGNGVRDTCQIASQPALDCNHDGILDSCQAGSALDCDSNGQIDACEIAVGAGDTDHDGRLDACEIRYGDFNLDGRIDGADLGGLLAVWGLAPPPYGDLTDDGRVDGADLGVLLSRWGSNP